MSFDEAFFANQEAKALQADLWLWGSVNVKNTFFREQITNMAKKKLPNVTVKIPEKTALDIALGAGGYPKGRIVEIYGQNLLVKQQSLFMPLQRFKKKVELQPLSMLKMRLTQNMQKRSVSISMNFYFHNQTMVNKGFKLLKN